jgi:hypothetical protein
MNTRILAHTKPKTMSDSPAHSNFLQRKCACGGTAGPTGECDECRKKKLQRKITQPSTLNTQLSDVPPIVHEVLNSPGRPLDSATRAFMEPRFGHDFGHVRVHTDAKAAESARAVSAHAYTVGHNIVFGTSEFVPTTHPGRELLAHELAHTIQQRDASSRAQPIPPNSALEAKADRAGRNVASRRTLTESLGSSEVAVARQPLITEEEEEEETPVPMALESGKTARVAPSPRRGRLKAPPGRPTTLSLIQPDPRQITDEELDLLPQAGSIERAREILRTRMTEERAKEQTEATQNEKRRNRTIRYFRKIPDQKLEDAYRSRLKLYLADRSKGQEYWDLEAMEEIVQERAPNAPWREEARQEFLAQLAREKRLPQLPEKVRSQFQKLDDKTQGWTTEERDLAHELLWHWIEFYDQGLRSAAAIDRVRKELVAHYETWLRGADRAIQEDCKRRDPASLGTFRHNLEKAYGDPCEPWFQESHQHGYLELRDLERFMRVTTDPEKPELKMYLNIHAWVKEFRARTNPEAILARLRGQGLLGIFAGGFGGLGARLSSKLPKYEPFPAWPQPSAGSKVGDIVSSPVGISRIVAKAPGGVEVLKPITRTPEPSRALPAPAPGRTPASQPAATPTVAPAEPPTAVAVRTPAFAPAPAPKRTPTPAAKPSRVPPAAANSQFLRPRRPTPPPTSEEAGGAKVGRTSFLDRGKGARPFYMDDPKRPPPVQKQPPPGPTPTPGGPVAKLTPTAATPAPAQVAADLATMPSPVRVTPATGVPSAPTRTASTSTAAPLETRSVVPPSVTAGPPRGKQKIVVTIPAKPATEPEKTPTVIQPEAGPEPHISLGYGGIQYEEHVLGPDMPATSTFFQWKGRTRGTFGSFADSLREYGRRFPVQIPRLNRSILRQAKRHFFARYPGLQQRWDAEISDLTNSIKRLEHAMREAAGDRVTLEDLREQWAQLQKELAGRNDWANAAVQKLRPDEIEVYAAENRAVVTDITQRPFEPSHNFKIDLYVEVTKKLLGWSNVEGNEFHTTLRQNPRP